MEANVSKDAHERKKRAKLMVPTPAPRRRAEGTRGGGRGSDLGGGTMSPKTFSVFNPFLLWGSFSLLVQRPLKFSQPIVSEPKASMRWYHGPHRPLSGGVVPPSVQQRAGRPTSLRKRGLKRNSFPQKCGSWHLCPFGPSGKQSLSWS